MPGSRFRDARPPDALADFSLGAFRLPADLAFAIERGSGSSIWTTTGIRMTDIVMSCGPLVIGHAHPHVVEAIERQARLGSTFYYVNTEAIRLAEKIVELVPCAEAVKFCASGSDATFSALRLARSATGRDMILRFDGGYLGSHDYGRVIDDGRPPAARRDGIPRAIASDVLTCPFNDLAEVVRIAEAHRECIAAVVVEPIQRAIEPVPGFLAGLRGLCDRIGALLIFDEVVTGFRLALGGAQEVYGVVPDLCALGKALGGGLPIGAVAGRRDVVELAAAQPVDVSRHSSDPLVYISGSTHGNPLSCAAGLATLDILEREDGIARMTAMGRLLGLRLLDVAGRLDVPMHILGPGPFIEPVFGPGGVVDQRTYDDQGRAVSMAFGLGLVRRGVFTYPGAKMYLSTAHTEADIDRIGESANSAIQSVVQKELLR